MSYYYFGTDKEKEQQDEPVLYDERFGQFPIQQGTLIIEEDTIYEIDEDCLHCNQKIVNNK